MTTTNADLESLEKVSDELREHSAFFWAVGLVSVAAGALALLLPHVSTLAIEVLIGAVFVVTGLVECVFAFRARRVSRIASEVLLGLLGLGAGLLLLVFPLSGVVALTVLLSAFFLASGALKLYFAWRFRPARRWGWLVAGGLVSIALGVAIWAALPGSAAWVLGLLVGIDLIFFGVTLIAAVLAARGAQPGG